MAGRPRKTAKTTKNIEEKDVSRETDSTIDLDATVLSTLERINRLEAVVIKMAHYSGNNRILIEAGLAPWVPGQKDMTKYRGG